MNAPVRRVVTGHDARGKAVVMSDGAPPVMVQSPLQRDLAFHEIWNTSGAPASVDSADDPTLGRATATAPPAHGTIVRFVDLPPEGPDGPELDPETAEKLFAKVGLHAAKSEHLKNTHPLMHRTESVDYGIVLSGEVWLLLDDSEVHLKAGDVVVQRGTIHAWSNRTKEMARMAFILVDGKFENSLAARFGVHS